MLPNSTFYRIMRGMPTGDAHSSGQLVPSSLGLAYVLLVETNPQPTWQYFYRTMHSEHPGTFPILLLTKKKNKNNNSGRKAFSVFILALFR